MAVSILIVSDKNETRGPMLEGWLKYYGKDLVTVTSAGIEPGQLNLVAAKAMMEAVIDIMRHKNRLISDLYPQEFDFVIALTEASKLQASQKFAASALIFKLVEQPLDLNDDDLTKLKKHRLVANELEEFAIEFVHTNVRKLI